MVQGVALELLCRLLFTEGSNPSLSVPSTNLPMLLTTMYQITTHILIPKVKTFLDIDSLFLFPISFLWYVKYWKEQTRDEIPLLIRI